MTKNRSFSSLKPVGTLIPKNIKKLIKNKNPGTEIGIKNLWDKIIGPELASKCEVVKISKYNNENNIYLKVDRNHLIDIDYSRDEIIEKINSYFGYKYTNKILINVKEKANNKNNNKKLFIDSKLKKILNEIKDESLKDKLLKLGDGKYE